MSNLKDAFFFFHDANARNDPKILKLRRTHGPAGVGCFWMIVECLREASDLSLPIESISDLAYNFRAEENMITSIINDFGLFTVECDCFYSARLRRSLENYFAKKEKLSAAGKKGNEKRWRTSPPDNNPITTQSPPDNNPITTQSLKEEKIIEEKIIENSNNGAPNTLALDVIEFLNKTSNKNFSPTTTKTIQLINARHKEGYTITDFKRVIEVKTNQWLNDTANNKYLRPETLFGAKFESYLNERSITIPKNGGVVW